MRHILVPILSLLMLVSLRFSAQKVAESPDGLFVAYAEKAHLLKGLSPFLHGCEIKIYSTVQMAHIQSVWITLPGSFELDTLYFSAKGGLLIVIPKDHSGYLFNSLTGHKVANLGYQQGVACRTDDSRYFIVRGNVIEETETKTGKVFSKFRCSEQELITTLYITPDEKFLIGQSVGHTWLWNLNGAPVLRKYASHLQAYDASRGVLVLLSNVNNELVCTSVLASSGKIVTRLKLSALTKRINAMADSLLFPGGPNPTKQKHPPLIFRISSARLSNNGGFASVQCYLKGTETGMTLVMNNLSKECTLWQSDKGTSPDLRWVGDSTFVLYKNEKLAYLMNARSEGTAMPLSGTFEFGRSRNERFIPVAKQLTQIRWSDNYRYVALPEKFKGVDRIYLHPTLIKQDKSIADSASFLCFGPESRMLYFQNPEQKLGFINTGDIEADMGGDRISKHFFSDTLVIPIQGEIVHDPNPPPGYFFPRITSFKHIREANASTPLHVYLKTMGINGTDNSLQVHLIDTNGVYYYGAADSAWRKIWCNLLLLNQDKATQITDFGITEYREDNNFYNGMCVAMDFSGSMGQGRGTLLQNGVLKFIASKLEHEGVGVVKYDSHVVDECEVTTDQAMLKENMNKTAYGMLARSTALLDALDHSIDLLNQTKGYENKFIILLTDGCENASLLSKRYVIERALKSKIRIFTIGLGEYVSEAYLQSIAYNTQGSYYRIYDSHNLDWIYSDIRNKIKNYYSITFKTQEENSSYATLLNICIEKKYTDTLTIAFNNTSVLEKLKMAHLKDDMLVSPFSQVPNLKTPALWKQFNQIEDFSKITATVALPQLKKQDIVKEASKVEVTDSLQTEFGDLDFPEIKFEFDKTIIVNGTDEGIGNVILFMKRHPKLKLEVEGHTDNRGGDEHNQILSQTRAEVVRAILISGGLPAEQVRAKGYGSKKPLVPNSSDENRQINRRIDFSIYSG